MTEQEYWTEVRELAHGIIEDVKAEYDDNREEARNALSERLWETIDGHSWIIYTHKAQLVLAHSPNDGYAVEEWGSDGIVENGVLNWSRLAFGAFYADVSERVWDIVPDPNADDCGLWDTEADDDSEETDATP